MNISLHLITHNVYEDSTLTSVNMLRQFARAVEYLTLAIAVDPSNDTLFAKRAAAK